MNKITVMRTLKSIFILAVFACVCQSSFAQTDKGIEYYNNKDYVNAVKCFRQAAEQGDTVAQNNLGNAKASMRGTGDGKTPTLFS